MQVERRPLLLVAAETSDGQEHSILLQNAETVKLVGPSTADSSLSIVDGGTSAALPGPRAGKGSTAWRARAVTELEPGDSLYVKRSDAGTGRHMGTAVQETLNEW